MERICFPSAANLRGPAAAAVSGARVGDVVPVFGVLRYGGLAAQLWVTEQVITGVTERLEE